MSEKKSKNGSTDLALSNGITEEQVQTLIELQYRQSVYVWDLPVRITHWVNVFTILGLSLTGYFIQDPYVITNGPANNQFLMGLIRFLHFLIAFVFTANVLFRIYWSFTGSKYARWHQFIPTSRARRLGLRRMIAYYLFFRKEPPAQVGHNPLAGLTYVLIHIFFVIQILTGFALFSLAYHDGFWPFAFGWVNFVLGIPMVRLVHTVVMWLLVGFTIHHVYSAVLIEIEERSGLVGSIVTGYKSLTPTHIYESNQQDQPQPVVTKPRTVGFIFRARRGK